MMNIKKVIVLGAGILCLGISSSFAQGFGWRGEQGNDGDCPFANPDSDVTSETISSEEADDLLYLYEEEKLAGDVYEALNSLWDHRAFSNIGRAEDRHQAQVGGMLNRYEIDHAAADSKGAGEFVNQELQDLYNNLSSQGATSLIEALKVGALIEEVDIADLEKSLTATTNPLLIRLYNNLMKGSRNHLRSFVRSLEALEVTYAPQVMSQAAYDSIISSAMEKGKGLKQGKKGKGKGNKQNKRGKGKRGAGKGLKDGSCNNTSQDSVCDGSGKGKKGRGKNRA